MQYSVTMVTAAFLAQTLVWRKDQRDSEKPKRREKKSVFKNLLQAATIPEQKVV